jgi:lysine N6-hydroxylase
MKTSKVYDIIGIGIGPFNLGLAALADKIENLNCIFFDKQKSFSWHAGMLLEDARLQVPFYADLVTLADPTSHFTYLNYLHQKKRIIPLGIHEKYFTERKEYNEYCKWVVSQLGNLFFGMECVAVRHCKFTESYLVEFRDISTGSISEYYGSRIVIGVGSIPNIPECVKPYLCDHIVHSSNYLFVKDKLLSKRKITIVGSGQSAAEIFYDILRQPQSLDDLSMITRSGEFFPMDYSRFALEKTCPEYIDYFYSLSNAKKKELLNRQNYLFKGINFQLIADIHDAVGSMRCHYPFKKIGLFSSSELREISFVKNSTLIKMSFYHDEEQKEFFHSADALILATGYKYEIPDFSQPVKELIKWNAEGLYDVQRNYSIDHHNSIFVQNAELHTHGFNTPDLGMGPYRNSVILNAILGEEYFGTERNITLQTFGVPKIQ